MLVPTEYQEAIKEHDKNSLFHVKYLILIIKTRRFEHEYPVLILINRIVDLKNTDLSMQN